MNADVLDFNPSLRNTRRAFDHWRRHRAGREQTPVELREQAVVLLEQHCAFHICKALGINAVALKRWAGEPASVDARANEVVSAKSGARFVPLPEIVEDPAIAQDLTACPVEHLVIELPNQMHVRVSGSFTLEQLLSAAARLDNRSEPAR